MKFEKKLIACSILALIIGVSSVFPLVFLMSATAKAETTSEPWFNISIPYAYYMTKNGPLDNDFGIPFQSEMNEINSASEQHMIVLNLTLNVDTKNEQADGQVEYYQIDVSSDKELIETMHWFVGTNSNSSFSFDGLLDTFHFMRNDWFDTDTFKFGGGGGLIKYNWTAGLSILWPESGSGSGTLGSSGTSKVVSALREAETVSISIYRIGWVTFSDNSTVFTLANNELVDQIQLEKFGNEEFLYNNLVPEDELSTINLMRPVPFEELLPD
jgi:hypothetical protein